MFSAMSPFHSLTTFHNSVRLRPHSIHVSISHNVPAYIGEEYPILIEVTNTDSRELEVTADVLLQPSEIETASEYQQLDGGVPL